MSPVIRIPDPIYKKLEAHAVGFDSPSNVIERLLNFYEDHSDEPIETVIRETETHDVNDTDVIDLNPDNPTDLTHSKIIRASIGGKDVRSWRQLVAVAHECALETFSGVQGLVDYSYSNAQVGSYSESGYRHYPHLGISIQGENANNSWRNALHLAKQANTNIEVLVQWRSNKKSAYPGKQGLLKWDSKEL